MTRLDAYLTDRLILKQAWTRRALEGTCVSPPGRDSGPDQLQNSLMLWWKTRSFTDKWQH